MRPHLTHVHCCTAHSACRTTLQSWCNAHPSCQQCIGSNLLVCCMPALCPHFDQIHALHTDQHKDADTSCITLLLSSLDNACMQCFESGVLPPHPPSAVKTPHLHMLQPVAALRLASPPGQLPQKQSSLQSQLAPQLQEPPSHLQGMLSGGCLERNFFVEFLQHKRGAVNIIPGQCTSTSEAPAEGASFRKSHACGCKGAKSIF